MTESMKKGELTEKATTEKSSVVQLDEDSVCRNFRQTAKDGLNTVLIN